MKPTQRKLPKLASDQVHLWLADFQDWQLDIDDLRNLLSEAELQRLERYLIPIKQEQFTISRGLLRLLLASYLQEGPADIQLKTNEDGKPYLVGHPIHFNISHSGKYLLLGFTLLDQIGVDIQEIYPISNLDTLLKRYFHDQESTYLEALAPHHRIGSFFAIWTAKEAYLKASGVGFTKSSRSVGLLPSGDPTRSFHFAESPTSGKKPYWTIQGLDLPDSYRGAVAVSAPLEGILQRSLKPTDFQ